MTIIGNAANFCLTPLQACSCGTILGCIVTPCLNAICMNALMHQCAHAGVEPVSVKTNTQTDPLDECSVMLLPAGVAEQ